MIVLVHDKGRKVVWVSYNSEPIPFLNNPCDCFWKLAKRYPEEILIWCEKEFFDFLNFGAFREIFSHDLIMASYALKHTYLSEKIGYVDQFPYVNINREVRFGTWRMSTDAGGIKGKTFLKFKEHLKGVSDFGFLLNSVGRLGQHNGLFCYSDPRIFHDLPKSQVDLKSIGISSQLFKFVYVHYKTLRIWLLFWCFIKYEGRFPLVPLLFSFFQKKLFLKEINFAEVNKSTEFSDSKPFSLDVIIPTLGRREYLLNVLKDLEKQTLLPQKVIVVEQNPDTDSTSDLPELTENSWPFKVVHHFTHKTGACTARNMALDEVSADWVFFADDDNRMEADVLEQALTDMDALNIDCLTLNYRQQGEELFFKKRKQWGTFGAGNSIVSGEFACRIRFDPAFDHGYGEDLEYGMQLRNAGCDIIYHPAINILHLKAPRGGFREISLPPWKEDDPKPSPTVMIYVQKYYNSWQMKGFKTELFLRNFNFRKNPNPVSYRKNMNQRWAVSREWANKLSLK